MKTLCSPKIESSLTAFPVKYRIAFGSCFNPNRKGMIWEVIKSFKPNHLVLLGTFKVLLLF